MRKNVKKLGSGVLCGILAASVLSGCGQGAESAAAPEAAQTVQEQSEDAKKESAAAEQKGAEAQNESGKQFDGVKLVYWSSWEATEPQGIVIADCVRAFEEETGAQVDLEFKGRKGIREGLIPALDADQQVDLFEGNSNKSNYGDRIVSLEDVVAAADYEKDSSPVLMELMRSYYEDGQLREIPYQMKANGYMYNKDLFSLAGITKVPETMGEFLADCELLKEAGITPLTTDDAYAYQAFGIHLARLIGSDEVMKTVDEGLWDRPEVLETAKAFEEMASAGYFSAQVGSNVWPTGQNTELATGQAAMYCVGSFVVNEVKGITGPDFQWGFFGYPVPENAVNGEEAMVLGSASYAVTSKCENVEAAFALIEKITRGDWDARLSEESIGLPTDKSNTDWPEQLQDVKPYIDGCTEIFPTSGGLQNNGDINPALKEQLMKLYAGDVTAEEFVANMVAAAK